MDSTNPSLGSPGQRLVADLKAGLVVFLVALPLCLGIALASNAPLFSGILAGIVGGLVVGAISRSHTSVAGPAAGLTAVVAVQIAALGSFEAFLLAVALGGLLQIGLGLLRAGALADFVPSSVIKGLLAAIGLILIFKQLPYLVGYSKEPLLLEPFEQVDSTLRAFDFLFFFQYLHPGAAVVGLLSVAILLVWDRVKSLKNSLVPGPLVVVLVGVGASLLSRRLGGAWLLEEAQRVNVEVVEKMSDWLGVLTYPDFTALGNPQVYIAAITIGLVASIETLLNLKAVDKIDVYKRISPPNRELVAQGCGNLVAGMIGGLPVTSVIVRSSVNVNSGGRTKLATLVHGTLLALCVVMIPVWLNEIPLSCLAAILVLTGLKLSSFKLFKQMWGEGWSQFMPFFITVAAILLTDLLLGIFIGLGFSILFILQGNLRRPVRQIREKHISGEVLHIELAQHVSFLNRVALSHALESVPDGGHVLLDARGTEYIDADVLDLIMDYRNETAPAHGVVVSMVGFKDHYDQVEDHIQFADYSTREMQATLTPDQVVQILKDGNQRFLQGQLLTRDLPRQRLITADAQHPMAIVLSGTSSRTPVELLFDMSLGDLFCTRVSGNCVDRAVLGSLEYACVVMRAKLILVLGHSNSMMIRLAIETHLSGRSVAEVTGCDHVEPVVEEIRQSIDGNRIASWQSMSAEEQTQCIDQIYRTHIHRTVQKIQQGSPAIQRRMQSGDVKVVGGIYDVVSGRVDFFDGAD